MKRNTQTTRQLLESMHELCGEISEDDGIDPKIHFRRKRNRKAIHKTRQLCQQVARAVHLCLSDCDDSIVQNMKLSHVRPNPNSSNLLLVVEIDMQDVDWPTALTALQNQSVRLQHEIARSIHRKRVPNLAFSVTMANLARDH